jgi:hypothetical protein
MESFPEMICPDCGAGMKDDLTCQEMYDELLAREFSDPACGKVHHLTVLCYDIQHPGSFSQESLDWSISALTAAVQEQLGGDDLLRVNRKRLAEEKGAAILRKDGSLSEVLRDHWTMTVADVYAASPEGHADRVRAWARVIVGDLG